MEERHRKLRLPELRYDRPRHRDRTMRRLPELQRGERLHVLWRTAPGTTPKRVGVAKPTALAR